jgi:hypothetical protein
MPYSYGDFGSSYSGDYIQSLLLERNSWENAIRTRWVIVGQYRLPNTPVDDIIREVDRNQTTAESMRRDISFQHDLFIGTLAVLGSNGLGTIPSGTGFYRGYVHFRGVVEAYPTENYTVPSQPSWTNDKPHGPALYLRSFVQLTRLPVLQTHIIPIGSDPYDAFPRSVAQLILNKLEGPPTRGVYYFDRIVSFSAAGGGQPIIADRDRKHATINNLYQGGSPAGDYAFNDPTVVVGSDVNIPAGGGDNLGTRDAHFRNHFGDARSLYPPYGNMRGVTGDDLKHSQFAEAQLIGWRAEPTARVEEYIELTEPFVIGEP